MQRAARPAQALSSDQGDPPQGSNETGRKLEKEGRANNLQGNTHPIVHSIFFFKKKKRKRKEKKSNQTHRSTRPKRAEFTILWCTAAGSTRHSPIDE